MTLRSSTHNNKLWEGLSLGVQTLLKGAHWPPFGNAIISYQKFTYTPYTWVLVIPCLRHIHVGVSLHTHLVRGESHIQRHANRVVATKDTLTHISL